MGIKAQRGRLVGDEESKTRKSEPGYGWKERSEVEFPEREVKQSSGDDDEESNPDEMVMVLMPRVTYDEFMLLAAKHGGTPGQAMSTALFLLQKSLEKVDGNDANRSR